METTTGDMTKTADAACAEAGETGSPPTRLQRLKATSQSYTTYSELHNRDRNDRWLIIRAGRKDFMFREDDDGNWIYHHDVSLPPGTAMNPVVPAGLVRIDVTYHAAAMLDAVRRLATLEE